MEKIEIEKREETGHFTVECNLSDDSIALLEEEIKFIKNKFKILNNIK